ncbi:MAG: hypothetical protein JWR60_2244 [Polaromonas sp.]|nr:hypothetical protein [Polaromonas sp.]
MTTTLTIRNLQEPVKQKLRMQAASNGRSMEAEAREILTLAVTRPAPAPSTVQAPVSEAAKNAISSVRGIWKGRGNTDDMMRELRGED